MVISALIKHVPFVRNMIVNKMVQGRITPPRVPLLARPNEYGMEFESASIMSSDGVRLSAWVMKRDSNKLVIVNHPLMCNRSGCVNGQDGVPVNFMPMLKALYDDGFNIITYDHRGQGESDGGRGATLIGKEAIVGVGAVEWQDFVGVLNYVKGHERFKSMSIALLAICMGGNAALKACAQAPEAFQGLDIKCMVCLQPSISGNMISRFCLMKLGINLADDVAQRLSALGVPGVDAREYVVHDKIPTMFVQTKADTYAGGGSVPGLDAQAIYDACPAADKELLWIGPGTDKPYGTGLRFDGYNYFSHHPKDLLNYFAKYIH